MIVIGTSLGGLDALKVLLPGLPKRLSASVTVVQHRQKSSDRMLVEVLQQYSPMLIREAEDKEVVVPGRIYLAPADYHLLLEAGDSQGRSPSFALSTEAPVSYARPSIDVLFESAADVYAEKIIGVILTGASHDGANGLAKIKANGGLAIVQEPATAESRIMPEAAIASVAVDWILSLSDIAPFVVNLLAVSS